MKTESAQRSYPLSPMQQGMLFHSLQAPQPGVDIEQVVCEMHEPLDVPAFEQAWRHVADRHAILRTSFHWHDLDQPRQGVHAEVRLHWEEKDWRGLSAPERKHRLESYLNAERWRGFNLSVPPLMRLAIVRVEDARYWLVWTFHHLLLDARAIGIVVGDVFSIYEASVSGQPAELETPRAYGDYLEWLGRRDQAGAEPFWRSFLKGFGAPTPLPLDRLPTRKAGAPEPHGEQELRFSEPATAALRVAAEKQNVTLNTLLQGAWALLLSRYSGEEDVAFGAVRACRRSSVDGAESMVGLLINTVPVRIRVAADTPVGAWLAQLRAQWLALRDYEHTPLAEVQGWSEVPRGTRLFETLLSFQEPSWDAALRAKGGNWLKREFQIRGQPNYPLAVDACAGASLAVKIFYDRRRFDHAAITRLLGHMKTLLEGLAASPEQPLSSLSLLSRDEWRQVVIEWNQTRTEIPDAPCVPGRFEAQAAKTPDALAVASANGRLSYGELNRRANELAHHLQRWVRQPGDLVGVFMERSVDMVVALLAIFKAGAAYVPLDPTHPKDRIAFLVGDAGPVVLLTQQTLSGKLPTGPVPILCLDADTWTAPSESPSNPAIEVTASDLAYVIYTSGSTGVPKGVEITHGALLNLVLWHQRAYRVTPSDRATQVAGPAFDASVWELWPYLTAGASVHIPSEEIRVSPPKLLAWLAENQITLSFLPTPLAEATLNEPWPETVVLRALLTGGEQLHRRPPEELPCCLINHYGPTENTVVTTWTPVAASTGGDVTAPPIGRPIANTRVYVLDRNRQPVPVGVPGELHVTGAGLARGYRNRPELTAERFIPDPFSREPGARLYRTGDRVRFRPDGNLEFLGRLDDQVKIRGHRIELGEIESVLARHPAVRQAAVVAVQEAAGENRLIAYVVRATDDLSPPSDLRDFLRQTLPESMVPSGFVFLDALPLTANGKVDRKLLPAPEPQPEEPGTFVGPRTPAEEMLAGIWAEVLHLPRVGIHDNFFDLGGHSLLATQVVSRIRSTFALEFPLQDLFASPTVTGLAGRIGTARGEASVPMAAGPLSRECHADAALSFAQERLWFLEQLEPGQPFNNIPAAIRLEGNLDVPALEQSLGGIVRRHEALRTTFANAKGQPVAAIAPPQPITLADAVDLAPLPQAEQEAEAARLAAAEARRPFDVSQSPLLRAKLLRLAPDHHWLLLTLHHIASDGWSMGVFYRELTASYQARVAGRIAELPELPITYAHYARWQRQALQQDVLRGQLDFWKQQLRGRLPDLDLPTDRPRPAVQTYRGATCRFALPPPLSAALKTLSRQENVTLFMLLLAAFKTLLHRYTGQEDILVGSPIAGRTRIETEGLIGFFLNTLVLRTDLAGDPTFRECLKRVRQVALDAYAHQDVPLEKLVDDLQPQRDLSRSPLFQILFILQNTPLPPLKLEALKLTPIPLDTGTAKFDLTLSLEETGDTLAGYAEYNTDLFEADTIRRLLGHFQTLLAGIVADPDQRLSRLPLLTDAERHQLLVDWNRTDADYPRDRCLHHLFEHQARLTPDAVAVVCEEQSLTYRQLDHRANRLAHQLRRLGVGPDTLVALCLERSLDLVVGLWAILKAGGAYVPLDPAYPQQRLAWMLEDSHAAVLLTQQILRSRWPELSIQILCVDDPAPTAGADAPDAAEPPVTTVTPDHLAYVIYTSGSTGTPKGVMITHRNVVNFFAGMDRELGIEPGVWLAVTSVSFDISVLEIFWTLARGFKVILYPEERAPRGSAAVAGRTEDRKMEFSLFYFSSDEGTS
ncbi:MAG: amino acid adenylation domain-containing protein, partial [Limisphaerales bacterium]